MVLSDTGRSMSLTLDVEARMIYWINDANNTIERSWINGTGREVLVNVANCKSLVLDKVNGYVVCVTQYNERLFHISLIICVYHNKLCMTLHASYIT